VAAIERRPFRAEDVLALGLTVEPLSDEFWALEHASSYTWLIDGEIALCSGIAMLHTGVGEGWALVRADLKKRFTRAQWAPLMREGKKFMHEEHIPSLGLHRLQMKASAHIPAANAMAQFLGFEPEVVLKGYGPHGEDFMQYVILRRA
jgi:hypothetical protein